MALDTLINPMMAQSVRDKWFKEHGYNIVHSKYFFEGGDVVKSENVAVFGYGFRSEIAAAEQLRALYPSLKIIVLELQNPTFYHLDTCFHLIDNSTALYYPKAFSNQSRRKIQKGFKTVEVS